MEENQDELKILGKLTDQELTSIQSTQKLISTKLFELEVLRNGLQYFTNRIVADHKFPVKIRVDYQTGIVYTVPEIGVDHVRQNT